MSTRRRSAEPSGGASGISLAAEASGRVRGTNSRREAPSAGIDGAIAQLGERYNGIVEVSGSIPLGSTNRKGPTAWSGPLSFRAGSGRLLAGAVVEPVIAA